MNMPLKVDSRTTQETTFTRVIERDDRVEGGDTEFSRELLEQEDSLSHGYTREYVACAFSGGVPGQICRVAVTGVTEDGLTGYMA